MTCSILSWICFILLMLSGFVSVELKFARDENRYYRKMMQDRGYGFDAPREKL